MNALILAAGYATRLYPLTLDKAKPLLVVGDKPIIEWVVDNLQGVPDLETIYVVTNDKFASAFQAWSELYQNRHPQFKFKIVNDGSRNDDDKLGAIGDINFVVSRENLSQSNLLIVAGDNLFTESLEGFVGCAKGSEATVGVYDVGDREAIKKYGNVLIDEDGIITHLEEKPQKPRGTLAAIALYYYTPSVLSLLTMANRNRCCVQSDSKARAFEKYLKSRSGREFTRRHLDFALQHSENVRLRGNAGRAGAFEPSETNI